MTINYVTGFAGTGKSTELIKHVLTLNPSTTLVLAPTHKALGVLESNLEGYTLATLHSALGWVPGVNEDADNSNQVDVIRKLNKVLNQRLTNIIIDEFSMMSEEMLYDLTSKIEDATNYESNDITLTLYGDPFQLPPVKATPIHTDPTTTRHLTTQHRAESKDIPELFEKFVHYLEGKQTRDLTLPASEHVHLVNSFKGFKEGDRALAFTNKCVGGLNTLLAKSLGVTSYICQEVQLGNRLETITVDQTYMHITLERLLELYAGGKLVLQGRDIDPKYLETTLQAIVKDPDITFVLGTDGMTYVTLEGVGRAHAIRKKVKEAAADAVKGTKARNKLWQKYYAINNAFTMDYVYASTVHKSQGSEFNRVWIHKTDMLKIIGPMHDYKLYARMLYVALSRAKQEVFVYE